MCLTVIVGSASNMYNTSKFLSNIKNIRNIFYNHCHTHFKYHFNYFFLYGPMMGCTHKIHQ